MKKFNNLKIGARILIGFFIVVFMSMIIGGVSIFGLQRVNNSYKVAYTDSVDALKYTERVGNALQRVRMNLFGIALSETQQDKQFYVDRITDLRAVVDDNIAAYRKMLESYKLEEVEKELALIADVENSLNAYRTKRLEFMEIAMDSANRDQA